MTRIVTASVLALALLLVPLAYKMRETGRVRAAAATLGDWSKGTAEQQRAIQLLENTADSYATTVLIDRLSDPRTRPDVRLMVVSAMSKRREPEISEALSHVLLPQNALALRSAAAEALLGQRCGRSCLANLLHYMERLWWGERPSESLGKQTLDSDEYFKNYESRVNENLNQVLLNDRSTTLEQLQDVYGLGSKDPSPFGIHMAEELHLREACNDLTIPYLRELANKETLQAIDSALAKIGCGPPVAGSKP